MSKADENTFVQHDQPLKREMHQMRRSSKGLRCVANNRWRQLLPALAIVALGLVGMSASPARADPDPIVASISGSVTPGEQGTFTLGGQGVSSQLGNFVYVGGVVITKVIPEDSEVPHTIALADTLTETLDLGNGNTLTLLCHQTAVRISTSPDAIVYRGSDRWTVLSGTGQFKNATGSGTGDTYVDLSYGKFIKVLSGTISKK